MQIHNTNTQIYKYKYTNTKSVQHSNFPSGQMTALSKKYKFNMEIWIQEQIQSVFLLLFFAISFRDACLYQYRWMFGKVPNGLWPPLPPLFWEKCCDFFLRKFLERKWPPPKLASLMLKILQRNFLDRKWPPPLWNFSKNSSIMVQTGFPYVNVVQP